MIDCFLDCAQCGSSVSVDSYLQREIICPKCGLHLLSIGSFEETKEEWNRKQVQTIIKGLQPCPHCGGRAMLMCHDDYSGWNEVRQYVYVRCTDCGLRTKDRMVSPDCCNKAAEDWKFEEKYK